MKKTIKLLGVFAIAAIFIFSMAACSNDSTSTDDSKTPTGESVLSASDPVVTNGITATDFSYMFIWDDILDEGKLVPLSSIIDGAASVKIANNKVNINLGTPKPVVMDYLSDEFYAPGITINPDNARCFSLWGFGAFNNIEMYIENDNNEVLLMYVDRNVIINGTGTYEKGYTEKFNNVTLNKGWNYIVYSNDNDGSIVTAHQKLPAGIEWVVYE